MKKNLYLVLLFAIASTAGAAKLVMGNNRVDNNLPSMKERNAIPQVLPGNVKSIDSRPDPADTNLVCYVAYADDDKKTVVGFAVPGISVKGYGGKIRLLVGLTPDRKVVSYEVISAKETGRGAGLGKDAFKGRFTGKDATTLAVKKDGGTIEAITGATVTSRAVCGAIADACARLDRLEGKTPATPAAVQSAADLQKAEGKLLFDPADPKEALKVLPKNTATATALTQDRFPIFVGKDSVGEITGYAVAGTGKAQGPNGDIVLHFLFGFKATRAPSFAPPPRKINEPGVEMADMENAQRIAYNSAMRDALGKIMKLPR